MLLHADTTLPCCCFVCQCSVLLLSSVSGDVLRFLHLCSSTVAGNSLSIHDLHQKHPHQSCLCSVCGLLLTILLCYLQSITDMLSCHMQILGPALICFNHIPIVWCTEAPVLILPCSRGAGPYTRCCVGRSQCLSGEFCEPLFGACCRCHGVCQ